MDNKKGSGLAGLIILFAFVCFTVQASSKKADYFYLSGDVKSSCCKHQ